MIPKVYVFTNESMPGLVKIGQTTGSIAQRLKELDSTSIPTPFEYFYGAEVKDGKRVEILLHKIFCDKRERTTREFFKVPPSQVRAAIQLAEIREIKLPEEITADQIAIKAVSIRKANTALENNLNLNEFGLPINAVLTSKKHEKTCIVIDNNYRPRQRIVVLFEGERMSVSGAAKKILNCKTINGNKFWTYEGELLIDRRKRIAAASNPAITTSHTLPRHYVP